MKFKILILTTICLLLFVSCTGDSPTKPVTPVIPDPPKEADFILESHSYGSRSISGMVKNVGNATGYNVVIKFSAYAIDGTLIDTASDSPANLGAIPAGVSAAFKAVFSEIDSWDDIASYTHEITWLTLEQ